MINMLFISSTSWTEDEDFSVGRTLEKLLAVEKSVMPDAVEQRRELRVETPPFPFALLIIRISFASTITIYLLELALYALYTI
jgi:hypothetical protein